MEIEIFCIRQKFELVKTEKGGKHFYLYLVDLHLFYHVIYKKVLYKNDFKGGMDLNF